MSEHLPPRGLPQADGMLPASAPRLGPDGKKIIETLPPLPEADPGPTLSEATGQPRRAPWMLVGIGFLYAASITSAASMAWFWWQAINITHFHQSARLLAWTDPRIGSWQSMFWSVVVALIGLVLVTAPAVAAFQAWNGHRWSRTAGLVAIGLGLLAILMNPLALVAIPLTVVGTAVLWLPAVSRYFEGWALFRAEEPRHPVSTERVHYGPLQRYLPAAEPSLTAQTVRRRVASGPTD